MRPASKLERQEALAAGDDKPLGFRFQFRPEHKGVSFYQVKAFAAADEPKQDGAGSGEERSTEQTLANNSRLVVIDQGSGPYQVLYVSGRPDWEFKFLRRALDEDEQIQLVGLMRIARRQPKFDFRSARSQSTSPLFDGFDHPDPDTAERADQPVLIRLGQLPGRGRAARRLSQDRRRSSIATTRIVIDDIEADFFTPDQLALLRNFVSVRGGGLLDARRSRFVRRGQVRPHSGRRALAGVSEPVRHRHRGH